ncbi:MAG TPA: SPOR domain-containing protein [Gemmatimonadota bacterium]|nr:SPOR domain-containing protein [Gemmatimonadota bacterium]
MRPRSRAGSLTLLSFLVGALVATGARAQDDPGRLLEDGRRAFERERYEEARDKLWEYLDATSSLTGAARMPQAEALYMIALMEPDAAVAGRHYQIIIDEFPASAVADDALHRLALLNLVEGKTDLAIQQLEQLRTEYPVSRHQAEIPLWIGQARLAAGEPQVAVESLLDGFGRVKSASLPREISMAQRDALAAEYAHWLARAYTESGDEATAIQYYSLLTLDYPASPQAAEAREMLAARGAGAPPGVMASAAGEGRAPETPAGPPPSPAEARPREEGRVTGEPPAPPAAEPTTPPEGEPAAEGEFEDIAVADPVAAAPEGVGRGEGRRPETPAEPAVTEPAVEREPEPAAEREPRAVLVQPIRPSATPPERPAPDARPSEDYEPPAKFAPGGAGDLVYLQVGAFTSATRAADLSKRLKADGFNSAVQVAVVDGRGFYRVRLGPFRAAVDAQRIDRDRRRLTELGYPVESVPATR